MTAQGLRRRHRTVRPASTGGIAGAMFRVIIFLLLIAPALARGHSDESGILISWQEKGQEVLLFPEGTLYPLSIADPHRVGFGVQIMNFSRTGAAHAGSERYNLKAGVRAGIVRVQPSGQPHLGWQLSVEGGFDGQFDITETTDNIGWDGNYGMVLEYAPAADLSFMAGSLHTSSHVGDEYAERLGRLRIGYTRNEIAAGASWRPAPLWRGYIEAGRGYNLRSQGRQRPDRLQTGLEFEDPTALWDGRMGWYAALDVQAWEERGWRRDRAFQGGLLFRTRGRDWRIGIEHVDGRPTMGEFFQDTERWTAFGVWLRI